MLRLARIGIVLSMLAACTMGGSRPVPSDKLPEATTQLKDDISIEVNGDTVIYRGKLTDSGLANLRKVTEGKELITLLVDSTGGEIVAGMGFGQWVYERELDIVVDRACLSSCANYVFTAGRGKHILPGAVVAWHGSAKQAGLLDELHAAVEKDIHARRLPPAQESDEIARSHQANVDYLTGAILRQEAFFYRIGVDEYVTRVGNDAYGVRGFFYLSVDDMARFGIRNVSAPEDYARMDPVALARRIGFPVTYLRLN